MAESAGASGGAPFEFVAEKKKTLAKKKVNELVEALKEKRYEVCDVVKRDVASGTHLRVFPDRLSLWEQCRQTEELEKLVVTLFSHYMVLLEECFKGKEKYGRLQVQWMEYVRLVQYERPPVCEAGKLWAQVVEESGLGPSHSIQSTILTSIARAVFNFCQQHILASKKAEVRWKMRRRVLTHRLRKLD